MLELWVAELSFIITVQKKIKYVILFLSWSIYLPLTKAATTNKTKVLNMVWLVVSVLSNQCRGE